MGKATDRVIPERVNIATEVLERQAEEHGGRTAFAWEAGETTYADLRDRVARLAGSFVAAGVERGAKVLLRMPNCIEFAVTFLSLTRIGAIPVLVNSLLGPEEVDYVIDHSGAAAAVTLAEIADPVLARADRVRTFLWRGEHPGAVSLDGARDEPGPSADTGANEPAFMVYTSGTTGRPKGIVHAHRWVVALGEANRHRVPPEPGDVALATGEWSFISALGHNVVFPLRNGVTAAILEGPARPERVLAAVERFGVTLLYSVATVYRRILAIEGIEDRYDLSTLRGCSATGEALEAATWEEFKRRVGCGIWEHYGVSEMQMVLGQGPRHPVRPGSIGRPIPGTRVEVTDEDYRTLPPGEIGRFLIAAESPGFFLGYHRDEEMTARVVHDGWYHTGDLAWRDGDGYYWIAGREDDCFKSRGIFISPYEIENALRVHPAVAEACVVPLSDAEIGNRIRAVVVAREGHAGPGLGAELREDLRGRIARYKVPHVIELADALPKSAVGKVLRREVARGG